MADKKGKVMEKNPSGWFFAEWISILGTFLVCFVFLFYQNQVQSARSDRLYEIFVDMQKDIKEDMAAQSSRTDKLYEMFIDLLKDQKKS